MTLSERDARLKTIEDMISAGKTLSEIGLALGCTASAVSVFRKRNACDKLKHPPKLSDSQLMDLLEKSKPLADAGLPEREIAARLKTSPSTLKRARELVGMPTIRSRHAMADKTYLKKWLVKWNVTNRWAAERLGISEKVLESWLYERDVPENIRTILRLALNALSAQARRFRDLKSAPE